MTRPMRDGLPPSDPVGERCKLFEMLEAGRKAMRGVPLLARLDGRAFHTFCRGLRRPFDERLSECMHETARALVEEFHPLVGYTQSDEITLAWNLPANDRAQYPFDGRFQKLNSVLAGFASSTFARAALRLLPEKREQVPHFDTRVWQVPSLEEALEVFAWREDDAVKNSVQMAAQSVASHRELHGKGRKDQLDILHAAGIRWNDYPPFFKRGVYFHRVARPRKLTEEERQRIPEAHRPAAGEEFMRSSVERLEIGPVRREAEAMRLLFGRPT
jgi:tRNA(His) guanylyltransferase